MDNTFTSKKVEGGTFRRYENGGFKVIMDNGTIATLYPVTAYRNDGTVMEGQDLIVTNKDGVTIYIYTHDGIEWDADKVT